MCQRKLSGAVLDSSAAIPAPESEPDVLPTLDIKDNDAVIAAYLAARSQPVSKIAAENRETLAEYAEAEGRVLVRHWEARIILPDTSQSKIGLVCAAELRSAADCGKLKIVPQSAAPAASAATSAATTETTATVSSTTTLGELVESLRSRGFDLPKKLSVTTASGKPIKTIESLTYKDVIRIIPRI